MGRIDSIQKNVFEIVPIMKELICIVPNAKLFVVGEADDEIVYKTLIEMIKENGLEEHICICGYSENVDEYYKKAAAILLTSRYEGFPMVLVESKCFGVPSILYNLSDLELLKDGKGFIAAPQGDYKAIAKYLAKVLKDDKLRNQLSYEARESIEEFATIDIGTLWKNVIEGTRI